MVQSRNLILFDTYRTSWFVIETHFTKTVPSKPTFYTHLEGFLDSVGVKIRDDGHKMGLDTWLELQLLSHGSKKIIYPVLLAPTHP